MNKKVLKAAFVAAIAMVSGINVFNAQKLEVFSDVVLANVEALASGEGSGSVSCCNTCTGAFCGTFFPADNPTQRVTMYYL